MITFVPTLFNLLADTPNEDVGGRRSQKGLVMVQRMNITITMVMKCNPGTPYLSIASSFPVLI